MLTNKRKLLFMFGLCSVLPPFIGRSIDLSLPSIGNEFGMTVVSLSWLITVYLVATAVLLVPFGRLADIVGRKKIFLTGAVLFTITTIFCCCAYSGSSLIAARAMQGIASAMVLGTATALLVSIFPPRERGKAIGISASGVFIGSSLGPGLGGIMTQAFGWRSIFMLTAIASTGIVIMGFCYLKDEFTDAHGETFDFIGSVLYAVSIIAMLYGTTILPSLRGYFSIGAGILLLALFCITAKYIKHPVIELDLLFKNKAFAMTNLSALFGFSAVFSVPFLMSLYLQYIKGINAKTAGLIILASPITVAIGSLVAGKLSDKLDPKNVAIFGISISATVLFIMSAMLNNATPLYFIVFFLFIFGIGLSFFISPNANAAMGSVTKKYLGIAASIVNTMRMLGQTISMGISMMILTLTVGKVEITQDSLPLLMNSVRITFLVFGLLCVMSVVALLARGRRMVHHEESEFN
jgi:EmrB/QacA subfamily drug resistance transporter